MDLGREKGVARAGIRRRASDGTARACPVAALALCVTALHVCAAGSAFAQDAFVPDALVPDAAIVEGAAGLGSAAVLAYALFVGTVLALTVFAWRQMQERGRLTHEAAALRERCSALNGDNQRLATLADARDRRVVVWSDDGTEGGDGRPALFGELPADTGAPPDRATFLGFGRWLRPHSAGLLEHALRALRDDGTPFDLTVETTEGTPLEVEGRTSGRGRFVRFLPTHASRRTETDLRVRAMRLEAANERREAMVDALDQPAWVRDGEGRLIDANGAYARATGHETPEGAVAASAELFGEVARASVADALHEAGTAFSGSLSTTVDGERRIYRVHEARTRGGSAGVAIDVTEAETAEDRLAGARRAHAQTLDGLSTAVATFDGGLKLVHWNRAFERMWGADPAFLGSTPSLGALLDHLRANGKLGDTPHWREWVATQLEAAQGTELVESEWMPPDGRTIHVVAVPREEGGATWTFENVTERHALASRATELQRIRDASIEHLEEGIAVFGPDGRLRLSNPAFADFWSLKAPQRAEGTHASAVANACADRFESASTLWMELVETITGYDDAREAKDGKVRLLGGRTLAWSALPLPNGQTMLTFVDMSDTERVAEALKARNEAMERADRMKNAFLGNMSYELRAPLTSIIGFTDLLSRGAAGPVTDDQRSYLGFIGDATDTLRTTVDEIIDLAAVNAGELHLDVVEVGIDALVADAVKPIDGRLEDHDLVLEVDGMEDDLGSIRADGRRLSQALRNVVLNAIDHTPDGGSITLAVERGPDGLVLGVRDTGQGIPEGLVGEVFEPFVHHRGDGRGQGAGLGLSVAKAFVELHGGTIDVQSGEGGTTVTIRVPETPAGKDGSVDSEEPVLRAEPVPHVVENAPATPAREKVAG